MGSPQYRSSIYSTGFNTTASGDHSTALGSVNTASSNSSTAMGHHTNASDFAATAMGYNTIASGAASTAMGVSTRAESYGETVIGHNNTLASLPDPDSWVPTDRLFVIGNGESSSPRSDAMVVLKNGNTGIGISEPEVPLQVGKGIDCEPDDGGFLVVNPSSGRNLCIDDNEILARNGGSTSTFHINANGGLTSVGGNLSIGSWSSGGTNDVCRVDSTLSICASSRRYKHEIQELVLGLETVKAFRPVSFKWKGNDALDLGFLAEDVAEVNPILTTYNEEGEIEGVKYKQLTAVLVNAIKEQQDQIATLQSAERKHQKEIVSLEKQLAQYKKLAMEVAELKRQMARSSMLLTAHNK